jgi:hypothetical protein
MTQREYIRIGEMMRAGRCFREDLGKLGNAPFNDGYRYPAQAQLERQIHSSRSDVFMNRHRTNGINYQFELETRAQTSEPPSVGVSDNSTL